jgi:hypothetical protein
LVYTGADTSYTAIALAYVASKLNLPLTIYASGVRNRPAEPATRAEEYGARLIYVKDGLKAVRNTALEYVRQNPKRVLLPSELYDKTYLSILTTNLRAALRDVPIPRRVWVPVGNGGLLRSLAEVWPQTIFLAVTVYRGLNWSDYPKGFSERCIEYPAYTTYKYYEEVRPEDTPPYPSVTNYDSKIWLFAKNELRPGDYIWNTGASA